MTSNLVWIDLEMSGLDPACDLILEIATIITDADLEVIATGTSMTIFQPESVLAAMDEWNIKHHTKSGLLDEVRQSNVFIEEAEAVTYDFISRYTKPAKAPLCGNSVSHDRNFLKKYMPTLEAHFHYRNIDVSSVKELVRRWAPDLLKQRKKKNAHRAFDDILESIDELKFYRQFFIESAFRVQADEEPK